MTGPRTCSHPIYTRTLTGVYQVVRMFPPCYFRVIISIGILESNSLSHIVRILQRHFSYCFSLVSGLNTAEDVV